MSQDPPSKKPGDDEFPTLFSPEELAASLPPLPPAATPDHHPLRKSNPAEVVLPLTRAWSDGLPPSVRPINLLKQYPRVANLVAFEWNNPGAFGKLMNDLLIDQRGSRKGFPVDILHELRALNVHYYRERSQKK